jgi:hypothetical protein
VVLADPDEMTTDVQPAEEERTSVARTAMLHRAMLLYRCDVFIVSS